ncbi:MAG: EAL domain-containing protein [Gammaproteobacteria bacterium]|nr:EAL domain-containing protein [Gammaproteobacteria bacterium]
MLNILDRLDDIPLLHAAINSVEDIVTISDSTGVIIYTNDAFSRITGYDRSEVIGEKTNLLKSGVQDALFYKRMWDVISTGEVFEGTLVNRRKDGNFYHEYKRVTPVLDEQSVILYYISIGKDVTESVNDKAYIHRLTYFDELTGLPKLAVVKLRLDERLQDMDVSQQKHTMLMVCINQIKPIKDVYGQEIADELIRSMSTQMQSLLQDAVTLTYMGSGRFGVFLEGVSDNHDVEEKIKQIFSTIHLDVSSINKDMTITFSVGISNYPEDGISIELLLKNAGLAITLGKTIDYEHQYYFYTSFQSSKQEKNTLLLEIELLRALERDEFVLHYQPQVDIQTGKITGSEALLRWQHPERGMVFPDEFIPVLESSGLIVSVGNWVLQEACRQNQYWIQECGYELSVSVNVSAVQLQTDDFPDRVLSSLSDSNMLSSALVLELTESAMIKNLGRTQALLRTLSNMDINIAIDDFGTGYSSLLYLKDLPLSSLKLDRTFSQSMCENKKDEAIAEAIVSIARSFDLKVVVEGIETRKQLSRVYQLGCHSLQGYLFSRPLAVDDMTVLLESGRRL